MMLTNLIERLNVFLNHLAQLLMIVGFLLTRKKLLLYGVSVVGRKYLLLVLIKNISLTLKGRQTLFTEKVNSFCFNVSIFQILPLKMFPNLQELILVSPR